jgi:hypothetical protein
LCEKHKLPVSIEPRVLREAGGQTFYDRAVFPESCGTKYLAKLLEDWDARERAARRHCRVPIAESRGRRVQSLGLFMVVGVLAVVGVILAVVAAKQDAASPTRSGGIVDYRTDTSEYARVQVRNEMIRQGTDPAEAEVFTRELYRAQREWEGQD